jgi:hypothetical protein
MPKFDREKFNTDPKHEEDRTTFDQMVEDSLNRAAKRREEEEKKNPKQPEDKSFFEQLVDGIMGK